MRDVLIGIDPSFVTAGVAIYSPDSGSLVLHGGDFFSCMDFLNKSGVLRRAIAVVENPNLDSATFGGWTRFRARLDQLVKKQIGIGEIQSDFRIAMKLAQHAGKSQASGEMFIEVFERAGVPVLEIAPSSRHRADKDLLKFKMKGIKMLAMPTKTTAEQFKEYTGYEGRSNKDSRDAGTLVHGRTIAWAQTQIKIQQAKRQ